MAVLPNMIADESARFLGVAVDKIQAFCFVFVYFEERARAGFNTPLVSSRLVIRLLKRRYHKQIRDAALHFHETKKHVGKFQRAF